MPSSPSSPTVSASDASAGAERREGAPRVTVVIVAFNSGHHLQGALDGLEAQTYRDFDVVLWDNASTDGAAQRARLPSNTRRVCSEKNLGFAAGNNRAAARTRSEFVMLLNPDAVPDPRWLERLVAALDATPSAVMAASRQVCKDAPARLDGLGDVFHIVGAPYRGGFGWSSALAVADGEVFAPSGAAAAYRRAAFEAAGGFDEDFFCYIEDMDLAFRMRLAGGRCVFVSDAVVAHVGSSTLGRKSAFAIYHGVRNRIWLIAKDVPAPLLAVTAPLHLVVLAARLLATVGEPRAARGAVVRGMRDGFAGVPRMWRKRRGLRTARRAPVGALAAAMTWSPWKLVRRAPDVRRPPP